MGKIRDQLTALAKLEDFQKKGTDVQTILFNSLPTSDFSIQFSRTKLLISLINKLFFYQVKLLKRSKMLTQKN